MESELGVDWGSVGARRWMRCTRDECDVIASPLGIDKRYIGDNMVFKAQQCIGNLYHTMKSVLGVL